MKNRILEKYVEDKPGEYTIWSASDLAKPEDQIPLVKVKTDADGKLYAVAVGDSEFDKESYKIAVASLESSNKSGKSNADALIRLDKSLNHSDPFMSVELDRESKAITNGGITLLAAQSLITLRDDLKAVANLGSATEGTVTDKFENLTGVNYYTDKIANKAQYDTILGLLLKDPTDTWNYIAPKDNPYIQDLKRLTASLIEKVNKKSGKRDMSTVKRYAPQSSINSKIREIKKELKDIADNAKSEEEFVGKFNKILGADYYTEEVIDYDKFAEILDFTFGDNYEGVEAPEENIIFINSKDYAEELIEQILLREDPDFYNK